METASGWKIYSGVPAMYTKQEKNRIANQCLEIANVAKFSTDYADVYSHLFGNEACEICLAYNDTKLIAFAVFVQIESMMYLHGIIIHPKAQGKGLGSMMIKNIIDEKRPHYMALRTHNPRMYETLAKFGECYPSMDGKKIPRDIINLVRKTPFTRDADEDLICRDAYPDEKIMQSHRWYEVDKVFSRLNARDAQVVVVVL